MRLLKWFCMWYLTRKAVSLCRQGNTVKQVMDKFHAEPRVARGMWMLDIESDELERAIRKKVKNGGK